MTCLSLPLRHHLLDLRIRYNRNIVSNQIDVEPPPEEFDDVGLVVGMSVVDGFVGVVSASERYCNTVTGGVEIVVTTERWK